MDFCHSREIVLTNVEKTLLDTATKTQLDAAKAASKKEVHKTAETTRQLIVNKYWKKCETKTFTWWESKKCLRNSYSTRDKIKEILNELREVL